MSKQTLHTRVLVYSLGILLGSFAGCSCDTEKASMANPEAVHQIYNVSYKVGEKATSVNARFRFGGAGGTNLELDGVAKVTHSACTLQKANYLNLGRHYAGSCDGHVVDHTFEYTDTAGKIYKNSVRLLAVDFPANMPAEISRAKGIRIAFVGDPLGPDERVELFIQQTDGKAGRNATGKTAVGANEVVLTSQDLQEIAEGNATIWLMRINQPSLQDATSRSGSIQATYTSAQRKVVVVP